MKILKISAIAICIVLGSCKDNSNQTTQDGLNDNNTILDRPGMDNSNNQMHRTSSDMTLLYAELNMSPEQINEFERMEREHKNNMDANNTQNQTQTQTDVNRRRDQLLSQILNSEQYQRYEQWKNTNN